MLRIECNGCHTVAYTENYSDPDTAITCSDDSDCCKENHHHGENANNGNICRPIKIEVMPGSITLQHVAGGN